MQDRPCRHARYHRPAVEPPAGSGAAGPIERDAVRAGPEPPSARVIGGAVLAIAAAALLAWAVPLTAVVLVWPMLFFVPGWVVIRRVVPGLPHPRHDRCGRRHERLRVGPPREPRRARRWLRAGVDHRERRAARPGERRLGPVAQPVAHATRATDDRRDPLRQPARMRRPGSWPRRSASSSSSCSAATAGSRRPMAGSRAAGTGATSSSTSRSVRASPPATSRRRSLTSPGSR